jgi:2-polyprenyl-3-methyl-5-hydroxy-6-metoxy-1,4-benzoquinol methylase
MTNIIVERITPGELSWDLYHGDHIQRYKFFSNFYHQKKVLDAACGSGYGSKIILDCGAKEVYGIDIDEEQIHKNQQMYPDVKFIALSCEEIYKIQNLFDVVVSFETIEHLNDIEKFFQGVNKILTKDGIFICSTPNIKRFSESKSTILNDYHKHELSYQEFTKLFSDFFSIEKKYHQSESPEFMRFLKINHDLHQLERQIKSTIAYRLEIILRKILGRPFQPIPFFYNKCFNQRENDFVIEEISDGEDWHKTFILVGKKKN